MDYLYKITIGIDDDKVLSMRQHDLNAVYKTVRNTFARCNFKEQESENGNLVFTIGKGKDSFSEVGIATGVLRESWLGKYLNKICTGTLWENSLSQRATASGLKMLSDGARTS